jgi:hypothetical protein
VFRRRTLERLPCLKYMSFGAEGAWSPDWTPPRTLPCLVSMSLGPGLTVPAWLPVARALRCLSFHWTAGAFPAVLALLPARLLELSVRGAPAAHPAQATMPGGSYLGMVRTLRVPRPTAAVLDSAPYLRDLKLPRGAFSVDVRACCALQQRPGINIGSCSF